MNTRTAYLIFRGLRATEIILVFVCFILEIIEYASFLEVYTDEGLPAWAYFSAKITKTTNDIEYYNGVKIFYYIVLLLTFVDSGFYVVRRLDRMGPFKRDITINAFFTTLWITSGIANIYPAFEGHEINCDGLSNVKARECTSNVLLISIGWINGFLFFLSTLMALKLWKGRQERYEGERRVEALGEVVYKYKPRPNTIAQVDEPEQVMIFKTFSKSEKKKGTPTYVSYI